MLRSIAFFLLALGVCAPAVARPLVAIDVVDRASGVRLPQFPHRGDHWIQGAPGHSYTVQLTNTSGDRVLVVLSVDGVNAVTGDTASPDQGGYVLAPWQSIGISGWRKSHHEIARFVFTDLPDSYAARTGRPDDVGVIGIAVFQEAQRYSRPSIDAAPPAMQQRSRERSSSQSAKAHSPQDMDGAVAETADRQSLGTGHGAREHSPVSSTQFERASIIPAQTTQLRYDTRSRLIALGVLPRVHRQRRPQAFPGSFVADPPH